MYKIILFFFTVKITFNVDYPTINNYIIVDETELKHYSLNKNLILQMNIKLKFHRINICFLMKLPIK